MHSQKGGGVFFGLAKKDGGEGVGGGPSATDRPTELVDQTRVGESGVDETGVNPRSGGMPGGWAVAPGKTAGTGSPAPLVPVPCRYLLVSEYLFSLTEEANSGRIWRNYQNRVLVTEWAWSPAFLSSLW